jgi:copper(I)-binding protein
VEVHRTEKLNGVMSMRRIAEVKLEKNEAVTIQPDAKGGEHMMLIGLKKPLNEGDSVKVTFTFKKSPVQTVTFPVKADAAPGAHELH